MSKGRQATGTPQRTTAEWQALDRSHHLHPFTDLHEHAEVGGRIISHAEHIYIYDSDGNEILDSMSGLWCCCLGYTQPKIVAAVKKQLETLPYYNSFFKCSNEPAVALSAKLAEVMPKPFKHFFFTSSGSEAIDTALRLVYRYFDLTDRPEKKQVISRMNAYHGSTIAGGSLGGMTPMHKQMIRLPNVHHIQQPFWYREGGDLSPEAFGLKAARALEQKIDELGEANVAAFIAEPIQGAGGVIVPPATYWPEIQRICDERDILLISDEVICGFGRTGEWFGCDHYKTRPDLITFAKGVTGGFQPLGGVAVSDRITDVLTAGGGEFTHGFTYSGHPAACAAGIAALDILQGEKIVQHVAKELAPYFGKRCRELEDHPIVGEVRTTGLLAAFELTKNKATREPLASDGKAAVFCRDTAVANGLMIRAVRDSMIAAPPFVTEKREIDLLIERFRIALDKTAAEFGIQ